MDARGYDREERWVILQRLGSLLRHDHHVDIPTEIGRISLRKNTRRAVPPGVVSMSRCTDNVWGDSDGDDKLPALPYLVTDRGTQHLEAYLNMVELFARAFPVPDVDATLRCVHCDRSCLETCHLLTRDTSGMFTARCCESTDKQSPQRFDSMPEAVNGLGTTRRGAAICLRCLWEKELMPSFANLPQLTSWSALDACVSRRGCDGHATDLCRATLHTDQCNVCLFELSAVVHDPTAAMDARSNLLHKMEAHARYTDGDLPDFRAFVQEQRAPLEALETRLVRLVDDTSCKLASIVEAQSMAVSLPPPQPLAAAPLPQPQSAPAPDTRGVATGDFSTIISIVEEKLRPIIEGGAVPFLQGEGLGRLKHCNLCNSFHSQDPRWCPYFKRLMLPRADSSYTDHYTEIMERYVKDSRQQSMLFLDYIVAFVRGIEACSADESPVPQLLARQVSAGNVKAKAKAKAKTKAKPRDSEMEEHPHNRIRNVLQADEGVYSTAWFGVTSILPHMLNENGKPSFHYRLDMRAWSDVREMRNAIERWCVLLAEVRIPWLDIDQMGIVVDYVSMACFPYDSAFHSFGSIMDVFDALVGEARTLLTKNALATLRIQWFDACYTWIVTAMSETPSILQGPSTTDTPFADILLRLGTFFSLSLSRSLSSILPNRTMPRRHLCRQRENRLHGATTPHGRLWINGTHTHATCRLHDRAIARATLTFFLATTSATAYGSPVTPTRRTALPLTTPISRRACDYVVRFRIRRPAWHQPGSQQHRRD